MTTDAAIGRRVHTAMWDRRMTQRELGNRLGLAQNTISAKVRGKTAWGAVELVRVAEILGVSISDLIPMDDQWAPWDSNPQPTDLPRRQLALVRAA